MTEMNRDGNKYMTYSETKRWSQEMAWGGARYDMSIESSAAGDHFPRSGAEAGTRTTSTEEELILDFRPRQLNQLANCEKSGPRCIVLRPRARFFAMVERVLELDRDNP